MRKVEPTASGGHKVRYRHAGVQTSQTFVHERDAKTFASILDAGGAAEALAWLDARTSRTVDAYTFAEWFAHYVDHLTGVTARTKGDYADQRRRYLSSLDEIPLSHLTRAHVAGIVNRMDAAGLSPKTIKNAVNLLASCLGAAVDEGHMTRNVAKRMRLPRAAVTDDEDEGDVTFLTPAEFARILFEIPDHYRPLAAFLVGSGLRWSEATALQYRHVDPDAQTVKVRRAWKRVPGEGFRIGPPKTEKSRRTVNPAPQVLDVLGSGKPTEFVFTTPGGSPVRHANFHGRVWRPAVIRASVCTEHMPPDCRCATPDHARCAVHPGKDVVPPCGCASTVPQRPTIHSLRHTHASWLISDGIQLEAVQDQLGHESILTTRAVYGHLLPALGAQVAQAASAAMVAVEREAISPGGTS